MPAVLYGHGTDPQHLLLPAHDFRAVLRHSGTNAVLVLDIDGTEQLALPKALDIHPIRRSIQHVDLIIVRRGEKVTVEVNVVVEGDAGPDTLVNQEANSIEIESDAMSIPEHLTLSVEGIPAGTQFTAAPGSAARRCHPGVRSRTAGRQRHSGADCRGPGVRGRRRTTEAAAAAEEEEAADEAAEADAE